MSQRLIVGRALASMMRAAMSRMSCMCRVFCGVLALLCMSASAMPIIAQDLSPRDGHWVLVIPDEITASDLLRQAAHADVTIVSYSMQKDSPQQIVHRLQTIASQHQIDRLALAMHGDAGRIAVTTKHETTFASLLRDEATQSFWRDIGATVRPDGAVDLLTCSFVSGETGSFALGALTDAIGRPVAASTTPTGNSADWWLEHGAVDARAWFDAQQLSNGQDNCFRLRRY